MGKLVYSDSYLGIRLPFFCSCNSCSKRLFQNHGPNSLQLLHGSCGTHCCLLRVRHKTGSAIVIVPSKFVIRWFCTSNLMRDLCKLVREALCCLGRLIRVLAMKDL